MSSHLTMVANPCATFSRASTWICEISSSSNADEWGTLVTAASISSGVQLLLTETGHPTRAYCSNKFAAGCRLPLHIGNTRPRNFPLMTPSGPVNSSSNAIGHQRMPLLNCFSTNFAEYCPVLVLYVQLPPTRSTHTVFSGWRQVESACLTGVLNSVLGIADGRSDLSQ